MRYSHNAKSIMPLLAVIMLTACNKSEEPSAPLISDRAALGNVSDLNGTDWLLDLLNSRSLLPNTHITLNFRDSLAGGFAGCNSYGGRYTATAMGELSFRDLTMTEMACSSPAGVLGQEQEFLKAIVDARSFHVVNDRLQIADASGKTILLFSRREKADMNPRDLVGTAWRLDSWNDHSLLPGSTITLAFLSEDEISGSAGCRGYTGTYQSSGDEIRFPSLSMTSESIDHCSSAQAAQEAEFTAALSWVRNYLYAGNTLTLYTDRGEVLEFTAIAAVP